MSERVTFAGGRATHEDAVKPGKVQTHVQLESAASLFNGIHESTESVVDDVVWIRNCVHILAESCWRSANIHGHEDVGLTRSGDNVECRAPEPAIRIDYRFRGVRRFNLPGPQVAKL